MAQGNRPSVWLVALLVFVGVPVAAAAPPGLMLRGSVVDEDDVPVADVEVVVSGAGQTQTLFSDVLGHFELNGLAPGKITVSLSKPGYFRLSDQPIELKEEPSEVVFTLSHEHELHERVEVSSRAERIDPQSTAHQQSLMAQDILDLPVASSHDLKQYLPTLPNVVTDSSQEVHVAGARTGQTAYLLDGFEIGDPATRELNARVNVDSVRAVDALSGRFGAQYANAGAGVLALETTSGDDRWRIHTTDFIPAISFSEGTHLGNWYPRLNFSGPIAKGRVWFSDATSLQHTFHVEKDLPRGENTSTQWYGDNLLRLQANLTPQHVLQASFLYNQSSFSNQGLGPFTPLSTTIDLGASRSFVSLKDQIWLRGALLELGVAGDSGRSDIVPQGSATYVVAPSATSGNYFQTVHDRSRRLQTLSNLLVPSRRWHGTHQLSTGVNVSGIGFTQSALRNEIDVLRANNTLLQRTTFSGPSAFRLSTTQAGYYAQDAWQMARPLLLQVGMRTDWDRLVQSSVVSPRVAANLLPWQDNRTKLSLAWGRYAQPVNLIALGEGHDQAQIDEFYDATGTTPVLGPLISRFVLPAGGLKLPSFYTSSAEWEQRFSHRTYAGIHWTRRDGRDGFAYENPLAGEPGGVFLLQNNRRDLYRAAGVWVRYSISDKAEIYVDYTRSRAQSNEALDYALGSLLLASQAPGPLAWDTPNRLLSHGWTPLPVWHLFLSYLVEYRTGFPFNVINQQQQLVGPPGRLRYPDYFVLNVGLEKRFRFRAREWALRAEVVNVTNHDNPNAVINNASAPNFLTFAGGPARSITGRLRLVSRK